MSSKGGKAKKKPVETTLGRAPSQNEVDVAHLRKPIDTSVHNVKQVISLLQTATHEVQNYITYECDIMYECKTCKTIFRSLANFILHKRTYCTEKYHSLNNNINTNLNNIANEDNPEVIPELQAIGKKSLSPIIQKLHDKQKFRDLAQAALDEDLTNRLKIVEERREDLAQQKMVLENIEDCKSAVFQTMIKCEPKENGEIENMKTEVMEIHGIHDSDKVVLDSDGNIAQYKTEVINSKRNIPKTEFTCIRCSQKFSTKKTLTYHVKYKHNRTRMIYVCPDCKDSFANAWCVYRHLYKVHRKTSAQVRRLRDQIHGNVMRRDDEPTRKKDKSLGVAVKTDDDQWLNNFEGDNDLQMCGGCGKRFERKAALNSHSQMCLKRIAVCNTIKENSKKKESELEKDQKSKKLNVQPAKGSAKRKPYMLRTYKSNEKLNIPNIKIEPDPDEKVVDINLNRLSVPVITNGDNMQCKVIIEKLNGDVDTPHKKLNKKSVIVSPQFDKSIETEFIGFGEDESKIAQEYNNLLKESVDIKKENIELELLKTNEDLDKIIKLEHIELEDEFNSVDCSDNTNDIDPLIIALNSDDNPSKPTIEPSRSKPIFKSLSETNMFDEYEITDLPQTSTNIRTINFRDSKRKSHRRKTISYDISKQFKEDTNLHTKNDDINFVSKSSPYMDIANLSCMPCQLTFPSNSELLWHMSTHFSWFRFQCSRCSFVSFSKQDCVTHAQTKHDVDPSLLACIVLPIPNWKSALMSHEFRPVEENCNELRGKLTDEIIIIQSEGIDTSYETDNSCGDGKHLVPNLFSDYAFNKNDIEFPTGRLELNTLASEVIDITEDNDDCFQIEMPQEIYIINESELFEDEVNQVNDTAIKPKEEPLDDDEEESFLPKLEIPTMLSIAGEEAIEETIEEVPIKDPTTETCDIMFGPKLPLRSVRNRTRSVKILQEDFLYDLTKVLKLNDAAQGSSKKRPSGTKQKDYDSKTSPNLFLKKRKMNKSPLGFSIVTAKDN